MWGYIYTHIFFFDFVILYLDFNHHWERDMDCIYIYILHGSVYDPGFRAFYIHGTKWRLKKDYWYGGFFVQNVGGYLCECVWTFLRYQMLVYLFLMFANVLACIFTYVHILPPSVDGKGWDEERECEKGRADVWGMDCCNQKKKAILIAAIHPSSASRTKRAWNSIITTILTFNYFDTHAHNEPQLFEQKNNHINQV